MPLNFSFTNPGTGVKTIGWKRGWFAKCRPKTTDIGQVTPCHRMVFTFRCLNCSCRLFGGWHPEIFDRHIKDLAAEMTDTGMPVIINDAVIRYIAKYFWDSGPFPTG